MDFRVFTATDPSSREAITYVYRTDLHPETLVAHIHDYGMYIIPAHRYFDEDVLMSAVTQQEGAPV
ncbi:MULTISPECIES: hypothetical protein [Actinomycetes]|uniref:Uncharacterized protein n=2 Tax=Actinomycetes TaxID=1760 RepID=A0ABU2AI30_9ACTN|nr:hypothetical protein [Glycomyces lechevalierae]MDR7336872.1 hypothetical protein [Glycomyces lechevalierae]